MNWIDRPIEPTKALQRGIRKVDPAEVERRRQAILEADRKRKLDAYHGLTPNQKRSLTAKKNAARREWLNLRLPMGNPDGFTLPPTRTLVPWHTDEHGCKARVVGCD